ncbi:DNA repair protein RecO [Clostridium senegalense]|uniref:DNA repair protein RecO n=1 Tax=Clostridium senegalense TaxID=1465809 RepID=UPI00028867E1|nr:DNA repair protein RecO [Clostridium senegalense]
MNLIKTRGIVLKTQDYKENDKLVWLFTEKLGKVSLIAKGSRKGKSKLMSITLPFCYGEFVLYKGRSMYILNEGKIIESFQDLLEDFEYLIYGSYLNELVDICCEDEQKEFFIFKDLITAFYLMKNKVVDLDILARAFELKILSHTGYGINLEECCICGNKINTSNYLSMQYYGMICNDCEKRYVTQISTIAYNILKFLNKSELEKVPRIKVPQNAKKEIEQILSNIISANYTKRPKSLDMLKYFKVE